MRKATNWKTTLAGAIFAVLMLLQQSGVKIGHIGPQGDFLGVGIAAAAAATGFLAKDKDVTGGDRQQ